MYNNIFTYLCFLVVCGLVVVDMVFYSSVALQIVCVLLVCVVCGLVGYIAHKLHKGSYLSKEQQSNLQSYLSENIALQNELASLQNAPAKNKINSTEAQQLITFNARLTFQISNLKTHLQTVYEQLQTAKNQGTTVVVALPTNEQNQTASNIKKQKSA